MNETELRERLIRFINDSGIQLTNVCRCIGRSRSMVYRWLRGEVTMSAKSLAMVNNYLIKFNY